MGDREKIESDLQLVNAVDTSVRRPVRSVQPAWALNLPVQQQSVLLLSARGPDGIAKHHYCKRVVRAYRAFVLNAASTGEPLPTCHYGDTFMSRVDFDHERGWANAKALFFETIDELPHHYILHLIHGVEILGYKHPRKSVREQWHEFYLELVADMHMSPETEEQMDNRLNDIFD